MALLNAQLYTKGRNQLLRARAFGQVYADLFKGIFKTNKRRVFLVMALDAAGAGARIAVLGLLSLIVSGFQNPRTVDIAGLSFELAPTLGSIGFVSAMLFLVLVLGGLATYLSVWLSRMQGRASHVHCLANCEEILGRPPHDISIPKDLPSYGLNKLLTQVCMHTGLASQTLLQLFYPVILLVMSLLTVLYLSPIFTGFLVLVGLIAAPIYLALSLKIHANASKFYGPASSAMGLQVTRYSSRVDNQYRLDNEENRPTLDPERNSIMAEFLNSWDRNLLANNLISLFVTLMSGFILPVIVFAMGYLILDSQVTPNALIALTGAFLYMISALQTMASYGTNLLRFFPQVKRYDDFVTRNMSPEQTGDAAISLPEFPEQIEFSQTRAILPASLETATAKLGQRVALYAGKRISKLSFRDIVDPLVNNKAITAQMLHRVVMASAGYRFSNGTLRDNLLGTQSGPKAITRLHKIMEHLGLASEFDGLPNGLSSPMNEAIWNRLSATARSALRLVPIMVIDEPKLIFLDAGIIQNLNPNSFDHVFKLLHDSYIFMVLPEPDCPRDLADLFITMDEGKISGIGDRAWFDKVAPGLKTGATAASLSVELETTLI